MKKTFFICLVAAISAALTASVFSSPKEVVVDDPSAMSNVEALTQGEGYVEYDKYCTDKGDGCCPSPSIWLPNDKPYIPHEN